MIDSRHNSARLTASFDWSLDLRTKKVTRSQEAYRLDTRRLAQSEDEEDYAYGIVDTKLRVRGAGRVMRIRYDSSPGKDLVLIGYAILGVVRDDSEGSK